MSIPVEVDQIASEMERFGESAYVVSVRENATPHLAHVTIRADGQTLRCGAGRSAQRNVAVHDTVSILWPPFEPGGYSMIVDGTARVDGEDAEATLVISPTSGVLHRPAVPGDAGGASAGGCGADCEPVG